MAISYVGYVSYVVLYIGYDSIINKVCKIIPRLYLGYI